MSADDLNVRVVVREELQSALDGGQFDPGGYLHEGVNKVIGPDELALDLVCFSPALEGMAVDAVLPHASEWLTEHDAVLRGRLVS